MKDRKAIEKQTERISVLIRLNEFTKNIVESGYKEWDYNSQQEFYTTAVKELVDKHLNQFSKDNDDEFSKLDSFDLSSLNTKIEQLSSQVRSLREMCDHNFKVQSILMSYVVMLSAGYLTFVNRDELISPVKNIVKKEFDNIEDTTIEQLLINLLENKYDGFKNSSHH